MGGGSRVRRRGRRGSTPARSGLMIVTVVTVVVELIAVAASAAVAVAVVIGDRDSTHCQ